MSKRNIFQIDSVQNDAVKMTIKTLKSEGKALIYMATGTGKTETALKLFESLDNNKTKRLLWVTHSIELQDQVQERILSRALRRNLFEYCDVGAFARHAKDTQTKIVVASVQSLARHLKTYFSPDDFDVIIVDECHHTPAKNWAKVVNYFNGLKIGLSGTIVRPDGLGLEEYFGNVSFDLSFKKAQEYRLLAPCENKVILTDSVLNGRVNINGEYSAKQLDKLFTSEYRNTVIVKSYRDHARKAVVRAGMKPKAICFCINIRHAKMMAGYFTKHGIPSAFVCGDASIQTAEERQSNMDAFRKSDEIEILCSVNILNEGVDIPEANIAIMCRPTQSNIVYSQQIGRVARIDGGKKKFFFVLDFVDQTDSEFFCYTTSSLTGRPTTKNDVVVEYLSDADPVVVEKRVGDVMARRDEFEANMIKKIDTTKLTRENLILWKQTGAAVWER